MASGPEAQGRRELWVSYRPRGSLCCEDLLLIREALERRIIQSRACFGKERKRFVCWAGGPEVRGRSVHHAVELHARRRSGRQCKMLDEVSKPAASHLFVCAPDAKADADHERNRSFDPVRRDAVDHVSVIGAQTKRFGVQRIVTAALVAVVPA
jgi:hypothetical protein